ncbi:prenyltransferase/squalene oxidase repeat-containing protein [Embleya scabrispora]|uniref:prenyltransferase/squalene oxidase repeat-containing protein n=1 Tax=Embleya scabrispora TaxID=159449 RepID=UPI00035C68D0|nr:prenyltransferase/squalene oxidase repeat-containing protein [Embleya scabrispora]MYS82712.1 cell wall anchor protein [Streptomyces sp. SID5474]
MFRFTVAPTCAVAVCGAVLVAVAPVLPASADAANPYAAAGAAAAEWQAGELVAGGIPGFAGPDWGLTIDTMMALAATRSQPTALGAAADAVAANVRKYTSAEEWGLPGSRIAGATAKVLFAAVVADRDPTGFGGLDMRAETLDLIAGADAGDDAGRIRDKLTGSPDSGNAFGQSLAVLGLARSGGVPQSAVDFLIKQQCPSGGFRLYPGQLGSTGATCQDTPTTVLDPDSTGMAVQALLAAATESKSVGAAAAARKGADWLKSKQRADGSFGGSGPTVASNTNSTGLAGQALHAAGYPAESDRAAAWVLEHQITKDNAGAADREIGTIAYNAEALTSARAEGIPEFQRDQWRRATPQALLVLADVPLGDLGKAPTGPTGTATTSATATATTSPTATRTASPTTSTSTSAASSATNSPSATTSAGRTASASASSTITTPGSVSGGNTGAGSGSGGGRLARTGAQVGGLTLLAIGLVGTGLAVRAGARRRNGDHA